MLNNMGRIACCFVAFRYNEAKIICLIFRQELLSFSRDAELDFKYRLF